MYARMYKEKMSGHTNLVPKKIRRNTKMAKNYNSSENCHNTSNKNISDKNASGNASNKNAYGKNSTDKNAYGKNRTDKNANNRNAMDKNAYDYGNESDKY